MKPTVGSVLPPVVKPRRLKPTPGWEIDPPPTYRRRTAGGTGRRYEPDREGYVGLSKSLEDHGTAGPAEERLHEAQRERRLNRGLNGVLADEVEDDLIGKPHQQLAARCERLPMPAISPVVKVETWPPSAISV